MEYQAGSMGIQIQRICDALNTQGETQWATRIDEAYYSHFGIDAIKAALSKLQELQRETELTSRLDIADDLNDVVKILSLATLGDSQGAITESDVKRNRALFEQLTASDDKPTGSISQDAAKLLLDSLKNDRK